MRKVGDVGVKLFEQLASAPELNPVERVIEELRRRVDGEVYEEIEKKQAAIARELKRLAADVEGVKRLAGWGWIREAAKKTPSSKARILDRQLRSVPNR